MYLGLTGNIASGKSTIAALFEKHGCYTIDADNISRIVMAPDGSAYPAIVEAFSHHILDDQQQINRAALKDIVFQDESKRKLLESIVHPAIHDYERKWVGSIKGKDDKAIIITHAALIIEKDSYKRFDSIIVINVNEQIQRSRLLKRDGMNPKLAEKIMNSQMPINEKLKYANFIIDNNGSIDDLAHEVERVMELLRTYQHTYRQIKKDKNLKDISKFKCF